MRQELTSVGTSVGICAGTKVGTGVGEDRHEVEVLDHAVVGPVDGRSDVLQDDSVRELLVQHVRHLGLAGAQNVLANSGMVELQSGTAMCW